jgi:hypothetical protein
MSYHFNDSLIKIIIYDALKFKWEGIRGAKIGKFLISYLLMSNNHPNWIFTPTKMKSSNWSLRMSKAK